MMSPKALSTRWSAATPHVFGGEPGSWDEIKTREREAKGVTSLLDDVPRALPALVRAVKLSKRAASVGFVWPTIAEVMAKLAEEVAELEAEIAAGDQARAADELGDILFVCANIGRHLGIDPEAALGRLERQVHAALSVHRGGAAGARPHARRCDARRDGGVVAGGEVYPAGRICSNRPIA